MQYNTTNHSKLNPQAAVYVIEAQLALLLRLAGVGGPGGRMGSAKALQDAAAIPYLCRYAVCCICVQGGWVGVFTFTSTAGSAQYHLWLL